MMTTDGTERGKRERDRSRIVESEGLQWASHGTRLATSCRPEPLWNVKQWLSPVEILTVGTQFLMSVSWLSRVSYFQTQLWRGQQSGDYFLYWKLDFTWSSSSVSCSGEESTRHAGTFDSKTCTLTRMVIYIRFYVAFIVRSECVTYFVVKCCVQKRPSTVQ